MSEECENVSTLNETLRKLDALRAENERLRGLLYRAYPYIEDATYDEGEALQAKRTVLSDIDAALVGEKP